MAVADHELLGQVSDFYHSRLTESPKALKYLEKRGITGEAIKQFQIGFCDRSLARRLPITKTQAGKEIRDRLKEVGVLKKETGNETLRGCVTFPVHLHGGGVGEIYGRRIDNYPAAKTPLHWYLSDQHVGVWNLAALQASDEIILCESIIDALSFWCAGYRNVTTCYGTDGFNDAIHKALVAHNVKRILIAFDNDESGNTAADELAQQLLRDNFEVFRIKFPAGMDVSEYSKTAQSGGGGNVQNWLGLVIRNADWLGKGKAPELTTNAPNFLAEVREKIAAEREQPRLPSSAQETKRLGQHHRVKHQWTAQPLLLKLQQSRRRRSRPRLLQPQRPRKKSRPKWGSEKSRSPSAIEPTAFVAWQRTLPSMCSK